ncbi:quercetin dioxygenase-like cupin family protein [Saccharothrix tamanrassetensis]|uniref:Quercetin dioxygenase-like cupin family protein n=1 Tax=Saccharothrix tamanrassetensis TaxID=1051531 RepID=A0A841CN95_9PSEU|nr:cupin domain-containing protein [Saccharothrix tamanrassetensis]MBB5959932.1 quercetin dioxygenase-like cupin family protein [Saccharothrix tamanrassetensis]
MGNTLLVRADKAEKLTADPAAVVTLLADLDGLTGNRSTFLDGANGAPPHFHTRASELFFVLDGTLQVLLDQDVITLERGDFLVVPPRVPHAFGALKGADADVLFVFTPGMGRFDYYRLLDRVQRGLADPAEIGASQDLYDNHYVDSPAWKAAR